MGYAQAAGGHWPGSHEYKRAAREAFKAMADAFEQIGGHHHHHHRGGGPGERRERGRRGGPGGPGGPFPFDFGRGGP
ncbi:MAG: PadR family transcriptional regulator, partial [Nonomuraea sp.]|nr:PadR family transcriptional regulator [Nonomuraea sp.]